MTETGWDAIYARGKQLNRYPYSEVVSFFFRNRPEPPAVALDVGCGSGVHAAFMAEQGMDVLAVDGSRPALAAARDLFPHPSIRFEEASFADFDPGQRKFDLVVDRCSTTHSSAPITQAFYARLKGALNPDARIFWQGFAWDNSGRELGSKQEDGSWNDFTGGVFAPLGRTTFFDEADVRRVFAGYRIDRLRHLSDRDADTGYDHTSWIVEAVFDG